MENEVKKIREKEETKSLEEAQQNKIDHIVKKLDIKEGMKVLKSNWNGPIMFYPEIHKFDTSTMQALITENEIEFVDKCSELIDDQVKIIGGCCGVTDKHLKSLITKFS